MKPSIRKIAVRAGAVTAAAAVAAAIGIAPGGAAKAEAGTACQQGYVCLFARYGNADFQERFFAGAISNYTTWQWGTYVGGWHLVPDTSIDNDVDAVNYNWQKDQVVFWDKADKSGYITDYLPGQAGYRNWTEGNINRASRHDAIRIVP